MIPVSEREGVRQAPFTRRANGHTIVINGGDPADEAIRLAAFDWLTRQRLHQSAFHELGIAAYEEHCVLCSLRHREPLDAARVIADADDRGDPVVRNGLSLCKIHHAAYDQSILRMTPEYRIEVRQDILDETDGPMLTYGLQELHHRDLRLPRSRHDWPDRDRLDQRYRSFRQAG